MDTTQIDKILTNLAGIEKGLAKIYLFLAERKNFSKPVQKFWRTLHEEELKHEALFQELRQALQANPQALELHDLDHERLQDFVGKVNTLIKEVQAPDLSEAAAYSIGAKIEAEFDESEFFRKILLHDEKLRTKVRCVANDCKRHAAMLIAYNRGAR